MNATELKRVSAESWEQGNLKHLDMLLEQLRALLARRVLWVRQRHARLRDGNGDATVIRDSAVDVWLEPFEPGEVSDFYDTDEAARAVTDSISAQSQRAAASRAELAREYNPPAIDLLASQFNLTDLERGILLLAAAPDIDPVFGRLYAYVQDDSALLHATPRLVEDLLCSSWEERCTAQRALLPESSLCRYGLVRVVNDTYPLLRVDRRIIDYLRGLNRLDEPVAMALTSLSHLPSLPSHHDLAQQLLDSLKTDGRKRWTALNLVGPSSSANLSLAVAFGRRVGLNVHRLDITRLTLSPGERTDFMRLLAREAVLAQILLYIDMPEQEGLDSTAYSSVLYWVEHLPLFFIVSSRVRLNTDRTLRFSHTPQVTVSDRSGLWHEALSSAGVNVSDPLDHIVEQFQFGPQEAFLTAQGMRYRAGRHGSKTVSAEEVWEACREQSQGQLTGMARQIRPVYEWDDIVVTDGVRAQLREIAGQVAGRAQVYQQWGFGHKLVRGRGISALFSGASGTGKTMAAEVLANALHLELYGVELPSMVSKYIGETEKNLRRIFDAADRCGVILFFDEADALFGRRTEVKDSHDRFANIEINYLLQRMEEYSGLSILATNRKNDIDRAFLRRLRFLVDFPFPEADQRLAIWRKAFPADTPLGEIDYETLSRLEVAGGHIRNIALSAAFLAASEQKPVTMRHLLHAARREYGKMDKMIAETDFLRNRNVGP